jgi:crossover junction endodeoxyribonuclease RuvC
MKILGIDPGYAIAGYGIIEYSHQCFKMLEYGAVTTPADLLLADRLKMIYDGIGEIMERNRPDFVAVEELFFNTNVKTAIAVGHGRGVLMLAAANRGIPVFEYTPLQVKQAVVGYGRADKNQVQQMVKMLLGLSKIPKPDDAADALAVAICHAHSYKVLNATGRM